MDVLKYRFKTKLPAWFEMKRHGIISKGNGYYKNIERGNCRLKLQTSGGLYARQTYVNVELSAPKLLYGSNVEMVTADDLEYLNDTVTSIIAEESPCIPFEASEAEITRLDLAHNFATGSESYAHAYRDEMRSLTSPFSRRLRQEITTKDFDVDTVYWKNNSQTILVYPKFAETKKLLEDEKASVRHLEKARGMLRLEHRFLKPDVVGKVFEKFGYRNRADDVVPHLLEMTQEIMKKDMNTLGLDSPMEITGELERLNKLQKACGDNTEKLQSLLAFLTSCDLVGESNVVGMGLIKQKTFDKRKGELKRMGISLSKPKRAYVLPPLPVPSYHDAGKQFNKSKFVSLRRISPDYIPDSTVCVDGIF